MMDAGQLLREYAEHGSEAAFGQLVERYVDLVYSVALRRVYGDRHLAQDVVQMVFTDLARKARRLPDKLLLGGWLHRHTCFVASNLMRANRRRQAHERHAIEMSAPVEDPNAVWEHLAPDLDEAINQLAAGDRTAIMLRFFERRDFQGIGQALGISDDAAQKRVARALDKLRAFLVRRGFTLSATALGTALTGQPVTAAPAGLAALVTGTALAGAATGGAAVTLLQLMTTMKFKAAVAVLAVAGMATPLVLQHQANANLRAENQRLHEQVARLDLRRAEPAPAAQPAVDEAELQRLRSEHLELLRLRGEVGRLQRENRELLAQAQSSLKSERPQGQAPGTKPTAAGNEVFAPGVLNLKNTDIVSVLPIYKELTGRELVIDSSVNRANVYNINLTTDRPLTRAEVVKLLEQALGEQAGVEFTPLGEQYIRVNYNSALKARPGQGAPTK